MLLQYIKKIANQWVQYDKKNHISDFIY